MLWKLGGCLAVAVLGCRQETPSAAKSADLAESAEMAEGAWIDLDDGWEEVQGGGEVAQAGGTLRLGQGYPLTGARWRGEIPTVPFEFTVEARRVLGSDFFFSLTFPGRTEDEAASLIVGGWGGGLVGISSIDGLDASENETCRFLEFENGTWYRIRLRVTEARIGVWIDDRPVTDVSIEDRRLSLRLGPIEDCLPFGVATFGSEGEMRRMRWRPVSD